ncbi:carbohydrate kinase family protein [Flagellimonas allohymeniacidonis]|uniref:Carbohydrate kinase family protein n=1 Tax=Flagellimonas allohymeniacidonis TaxID=2517819 RepID=A0A4Q8QJT2_9FLAO|nr:carbohydrate kinase family protein [Allomuricauda hymeniacidonis]TAI49013.1 carbohydrate kinase family protein [Allomuricauda hymeniacidonis]
MSNYNVAVLGPIPRDHITTHHGEVIEKYGCATHTAIGLSRLLGDQGTVHVVSHVRKRDAQPISELLSSYGNINTSYITSDLDQGDVIQLKFIDQNNRQEKQTGFMNPILPEDVKELLHCDVFVCVPITDFEVPLETIKYIKENSKGIIIFDAHGPTNTLTIFGDRKIRFWIDRDMWLPYIDVLKMNLEESNCSWFEKEYDIEHLTHFDGEGRAHLPHLGKHVLNHGVKSLVVTLDSSGGVVYYKKDGQVHEEMVKSVKVDHVVDTTGCGDSFAGGLGFGLLEDETNYIRAAKYANALGAQRTQGRTFEVFKSREETDSILLQNYGSI